MRGEQGYSLVELLVVLAIMAMIAVVALPAASSSIESATLGADARQLTTELRALRTVALDSQINVTLTRSGASVGVINTTVSRTIALSSGTTVEMPASFVIRWDGTSTGTIRLVRASGSVRVVSDRLTGRFVAEREQ